MRHTSTAFLITSFLSGAITVSLGFFLPIFLTIGVGPIFCIALIGAACKTGVLQCVPRDKWRFVAAFVFSTIGYVFALFTFNVVLGYAPQILGVAESTDIVQFRTDVWLGLLAAAATAAVSVDIVVAIMTGQWRHRLLLRIWAVSALAIIVTFVVNLAFHHYWSFLGVLFPLGEALLGFVIGNEFSAQPIRSHSWPNQH
jgi:hypothetical protein